MRLNLSWKVSLIVSFTIILAMLVVGLVMYQSIGGIVREQVNDQIALMSSYQWETILETFSSTERELARIAQESNVRSLADLASNVSAADMDEFLGRNILQATGSRLDREVADWDVLHTLSIVTIDGIVVGDSRYKEASIMDIMAGIDTVAGTEFIGLKLSAEEYANIPLGSTKEYDGQNYLIHSVPITRQGGSDPIGYLVGALEIGPIFSSLATELGTYGTTWLSNNAGVILSHPEQDLIGTTTDDHWYLENINLGVEMAEEMGEENYLALTSIADGDLFIASNISFERMNEPIRAVANNMVRMFTIALIVIFLVVAFFVRKQLKPLGVFVSAFMRMESGDLNSRRLFTKRMEKRRDEIGSLVKAFISMEGHLNSIVDAVSRSSHETASSTEQLSASSEEAAASIQEVAAKASSLAHSSNRINTSMGEFAKTVENLNESSHHMDKTSTQVDTLAQEGLKLMDATENSMSILLDTSADAQGSVVNLNRATGEIESIVAVINDIAEQTNLLSLNASIEAARAGEHGRGFAVVADEVRQLADETRSSTENIAKIIQSLATQTSHTTAQINLGATNVQNTKETFTEIVDLIGDLANTVREVTSSINLLSASTVEILEETKSQALDGEEILAATQEQAAITSENANLMTGLANMASELQELINRFAAN